MKKVFILQDTNDGSIIGVFANRNKASERQSECIQYYDTRCFKVIEKEVEDWLWIESYHTSFSHG